MVEGKRQYIKTIRIVLKKTKPVVCYVYKVLSIISNTKKHAKYLKMVINYST